MGLLTKLQAVNRILKASGKSPVSTLGGTDTSASLLAEQALDDATRSIQAPGLSYNTTTKEYEPDANGVISLPSDTLSADGGYIDHETHVTVRGGTSPYLYDMVDDTNVFDDSVWLRVVRLLDFTDMPDSDQEWAVHLASFTFYGANVGDPQREAVLAQFAEQARAKARAEEIRRRDANILDSSADMRLGARRGFRRGPWG